MARQSKAAPQILSAADYDIVDQAQSRIASIEAAIAQVEQCGIDCQQSRDDLDWARDQLAKIKSTLFPAGRPR